MRINVSELLVTQTSSNNSKNGLAIIRNVATFVLIIKH